MMAASSDDEHGDGEAEDEEQEAAEDEGERRDTIARRTRTKLSLVDVPIDALEGLLPDAAEPVRFWRQNARVGAKMERSGC
jgi:hypothetical protein